MHGGLIKPSLSESISAIYIILLSFFIKSKYYKLIFFLNGLSSSLAHSPYFSKNYPNIQKKMDSLDGITIYYPLFYWIFQSKNDKKNINLLLLSIFINFFINIEKYFKNLFPLSILIMFLKKYKNLNNYSKFIILTSVFLKIKENKKITRILGNDIKAHSLWHIFGAHMFKNLLEN